MRREFLLFLLPAAALVLLLIGVIFLVRRRMRRWGDIVQAVVQSVEVDDGGIGECPTTTVTYAFSSEGRLLNYRQRPQRGILPPRVGERHFMRYDARSDCLRELPSGRSMAMPILLYSAALSLFTLIGGAAAVLSSSLASVVPTVFVAAVSFLLIAIYMPRRYRRLFLQQVDSGILRPVQAVFQGYARRLDSDNDPMDVPVYLCFWEGRTYRIEAGSGRRPCRPGDTVTLYRDTRNGSVVEAPWKLRRFGE